MKKEQGIPYDGFGNVLEMLRVSDQAFREKILRGIAQRDRALAQRLLAALKDTSYEDSSAKLARTQRAQQTKNYGL